MTHDREAGQTRTKRSWTLYGSWSTWSLSLSMVFTHRCIDDGIAGFIIDDIAYGEDGLSKVSIPRHLSDQR
jgi:hypothetical protein